jgi:hypothetical protein
MRRTSTPIAIGAGLFVYLSGCVINDPNHNEKIRFSMARIHAERVLAESGSSLRPCPPDYELMTFWRKHYDEPTRAVHVYELYDFLKTSAQPGPDRFVIAYDKATRKTYLRADLRSNENLEILPAATRGRSTPANR